MRVMLVTIEERAAAIALALCPTLERGTLRTLIRGIGSAVEVWNAAPEAWRAVSRIQPDTLLRLDAWRRRIQPTRVESQLAELDVRCVVQRDTEYPSRLNDLAAPPVVLFYKGVLPATSKTVSIVGTRRASGYAIEATAWISETLSKHGYHVVSGLAHGVDGQAHTGALQAGGQTTAVLASGVDVCYPPSHRRLYDQVVHEGCVISEYPPKSLVAKHRFPERNRIIAALSSALIVVQAGDRSGALVTVDYALELGRDVYVVPGPVTSSLYRGSNRLLQQGAQILLDPHDFLAEQGEHTPCDTAPAVPDRWLDIYENLASAKSAAILAGDIGRPQSHVYAGLLELELSGWVRRLPAGLYVRNRPANTTTPIECSHR